MMKANESVQPLEKFARISSVAMISEHSGGNSHEFPHLCRALVLAGALLLAAAFARAEGPAVTIVTGPSPAPVEQLAAEELGKTLVSLFDAKVTRTNAATDAPNRILLGDPSTNPAVKSALGEAWPADLGEQGHLAKSTAQGLVLGGGSPLATLWAVAEYAHRNGVRVVPDAEYLPVEKPAFTLAVFDAVVRPVEEIRAWRTLGTSPAEQAVWGLPELSALFRRLALMKFNRVVFHIQPSQVFAGAEAKGSGIWSGEPFDVTGDLAGRSVFKGAKVFDHPALVNAKTPAERRDAAVAFVRAAIGAAKHAGLTAQIELESDREDDFDRIAALYPEADSVGGMPGERYLDAGWLGGSFLPYPELLDGETGNRRGFQLKTRFVADQATTIWSFARQSSSPEDPGKTLEDLLLPICGEGVSEPFANGLAALTDAGRLILEEDVMFATPVGSRMGKDDGGFMSFYRSSEPVPEWWTRAKELYGKAVGEFYRANTRARDGARPLILRYAKRATFALHYVTAAEAARKAGIAKAAGDDEARLENLELAIESMHNALAIYAEVATEPGDAGAIALINQEAYRPLLESLEE